MYSCTMSDFKYFSKRCNHWLEVFGLGDWEIRVKMDDSDTASQAYINMNYVAKTAEITLTMTRFEPVDKPKIDRLAFHEVCHLFLHTVTGLFYLEKGGANVSSESVSSAEHSMINTLTRLFYVD